MEPIWNHILKGFLPIDLDQMRPKDFHLAREASVETACERVRHGHGWRKITHCPCCGSPDFDEIMEKAGVAIVQCRSCSLGFSSYVPVEIQDVYGAEYFTQAQNGYLKNVEYRKQRFALERIAILDQWVRRTPDEGLPRLLDIGCGTGWFLEIAQAHGYAVHGQELSQAVADYAAARLNIPIWVGQLGEFSDAEGFSAITLFDVLEHTPLPVDQLLDVRRLLKPEGIALLFVPNLHSFGFAALQHNSALVAPAEHLLYFTPESMREAAKRSNLELLDLQTKGMDIPDLIAYYNTLPDQGTVVSFLREHVDLLQKIIDDAGYANHMRVVLRKAVS